jgi:hypothetical protein
MSSHDPTPDEARLQALFDATALEPSRDELNRLARAAAQIPEHHSAPSPVMRWLRQLVSALALATCAVGGWTLMDKLDPFGGGSVAPTIAMTSPAPPGPASPDPASPNRDPLLDAEDEALAIAALSSDEDFDEILGGSLDDPLASLDMAGGAMSHPLDGVEALFADDDELLEGIGLDDLFGAEDG